MLESRRAAETGYVITDNHKVMLLCISGAVRSLMHDDFAKVYVRVCR